MGGKSKKVTSGYRYGLGFHLGLIDGVADAVTQILVGDRVAWSGLATSNTRIYVNAPSLFGGDKKEGGVQGYCDVEFGAPTQGQNDYLQRIFGVDQPAYRKLTALVWRGGLVTSNTPYLKPWAVRVRRALKGWDNDNPWYPEKCVITMPNGIKAMNPAHIAYQVLTSQRAGMQWPRAELDDQIFRKAADTYYNETFGLCLKWTQTEQIDAFLQIIADHTSSAIRQDRRTGAFQIIPIRADYDPDALPLIDEDHIVSIDDFERNGGQDATNEIVVKFRDQVTNKDSTVSWNNLAQVQNQGAVVSDSREYPGIPEAGLALRVAQRDTLAQTAQNSKMVLRTDRTLADKAPGDVIAIKFSPLGIERMILRILAGRYGKSTDATLEFDVVEDVFATPLSTYVSPEPSGWTPPDITPRPITAAVLFEVTYRDLVQALTNSDLNALASDAAYVSSVAARPAGVPINFTLYTRVSPAGFSEAAAGDFTPNALALYDVTALQTVIPFTSDTDMSIVTTGTAAFIGDEIVRVDAIDLQAKTVTVGRGCVDTIPKFWPAGTRLWFYNDYSGDDPTQYTQGEQVQASLATNASAGSIDVSAGYMASVNLIGRAFKPYPAGNVQVNGVRSATNMRGPVTLTWASRNRLLQDDQMVDTTAGNVTPEVGTTYDVAFYDETNTLKRTYAGLVGTAQTWDTEAADAGKFSFSLPWFDTATAGKLLTDNFESGARAAFWTGDDWPVVGTLGDGVAPFQGTKQMRAKVIGDNGTTSTSVSVIGPGVLSFMYRGQSEPGYDFLRVYVDAAVVLTSANQQVWTPFSYAIPAGVHTVRFNYSKDGSGSVGIDTFVIDNFAFDTTATNTPRLNNQVRFTLATKRSGLAALQAYDVTLRRTGYGYNYGLKYGG